MTTAFFNGTVRFGSELGQWCLVEGSKVRGVGDGDPPDAQRIVDLDGGALTRSFCDAHVHLPATGLFAAGLDLRGETSVDAIGQAFAQRGERADALLFGGNFEDPLDAPIDRSILDRAVGARPALLARADMHSCVVSTALLDRLDVGGLEGVDRDGDGAPTGYLREKAASEAWRWFESTLPQRQLSDAVHAAARIAAARGVTEVHEMFVVEWRGWDALERFDAAVAEVAIDVVTYIGTDEVERVHELGFDRIGGDYFLDGSFGSHTAWMSEPYDPPPPPGTPATGISYRDDASLLEFFSRAQALGMQVGVHAIGDAAIEQAISTWERVSDAVGVEAVAALRHRIEHFECATDDQIRRARRLGLAASVQPAFDLYWGGGDGLYARRIGCDRAAAMNRFRSMHGAGLRVGAGSDSTVTPLDPMLQMKAMRAHHVEEQRLVPSLALRLHTDGARGLVPSPAPPDDADLVWLDRDPVTSADDELLEIEVLQTWKRGRCVWPEGSADG